MKTNKSQVYTTPTSSSSKSHTPRQYFLCPESSQSQVPVDWRPPLWPKAHQNYSIQPILCCLHCHIWPFLRKFQWLWPMPSPYSLLPPDNTGASSYSPAWQAMPPISRTENMKFFLMALTYVVTQSPLCWVGQKVHLGFSTLSYRKTQMNFLAHPIN